MRSHLIICTNTVSWAAFAQLRPPGALEGRLYVGKAKDRFTSSALAPDFIS